MGLLDNIERLINEPGSAVILKEHIARANDKYSALEKEIMELKTKMQIVEKENQRLKLGNEQLAIKIQTFEKLSCVNATSLKKLKLISCYFYQSREIK